MKTLSLLSLILVVFAPLSVSLQAKEKKEVPSAEDASDKKNTTVFEIEATTSQIHDAALEALAKIGCNIKKDGADYIEAKRPNKVGLAVGSGGEKLFVWIKDNGDGKATVTVKTKKTMVGIVGQKLWNEDVAADIQSILKA